MTRLWHRIMNALGWYEWCMVEAGTTGVLFLVAWNPDGPVNSKEEQIMASVGSGLYRPVFRYRVWLRVKA